MRPAFLAHTLDLLPRHSQVAVTKVSDDRARMTPILVTSICPYGPATIETARQKAGEALACPAAIERSMEMGDFSSREESYGAD